MGKIAQRVSDWLFWLRGFLPAGLPRGAPELDAYCSRVFRAYGLPDLPSYRNAIATMILHLGPTTYFKAPYFFALSVRMAQAKQTAFQLTEDIRAENKRQEAEQKRKEAEAAAQSQPQGEATPAPDAPPCAEESAS